MIRLQATTWGGGATQANVIRQRSQEPVAWDNFMRLTEAYHKNDGTRTYRGSGARAWDEGGEVMRVGRASRWSKRQVRIIDRAGKDVPAR